MKIINTQRFILVSIVCLLTVILLPIIFSGKLSLLAMAPSLTKGAASVNVDEKSSQSGITKKGGDQLDYTVLKRKEMRAWVELISAIFGGFLVIITVIAVVRFQRIRRQYNEPKTNMTYKDSWSNYRVTEEELANVDLPDLDEFKP